MINNIEFSKRLRLVMERYELSAANFAQKIKVPRSSISHLLSGRNKPSLDFILKVLNFFSEVEFYWLVHGKGNFPKKNNLTSSTVLNNDVVFDNLNVSGQQKNIDRIVIFYKDGTFENFIQQTRDKL